MTDKDAQLKQRVLEHCRWVYTFDKDYANWCFNRYAEMLPWLGLQRK